MSDDNNTQKTEIPAQGTDESMVFKGGSARITAVGAENPNLRDEAIDIIRGLEDPNKGQIPGRTI